jgi:hypothetical protein
MASFLVLTGYTLVAGRPGRGFGIDEESKSTADVLENNGNYNIG